MQSVRLLLAREGDFKRKFEAGVKKTGVCRVAEGSLREGYSFRFLLISFLKVRSQMSSFVRATGRTALSLGCKARSG